MERSKNGVEEGTGKTKRNKKNWCGRLWETLFIKKTSFNFSIITTLDLKNKNEPLLDFIEY